MYSTFPPSQPKMHGIRPRHATATLTVADAQRSKSVPPTPPHVSQGICLRSMLTSTPASQVLQSAHGETDTSTAAASRPRATSSPEARRPFSLRSFSRLRRNKSLPVDVQQSRKHTKAAAPIEAKDETIYIDTIIPKHAIFELDSNEVSVVAPRAPSLDRRPSTAPQQQNPSSQERALAARPSPTVPVSVFARHRRLPTPPRLTCLSEDPSIQSLQLTPLRGQDGSSTRPALVLRIPEKRLRHVSDLPSRPDSARSSASSGLSKRVTFSDHVESIVEAPKNSLSEFPSPNYKPSWSEVFLISGPESSPQSPPLRPAPSTKPVARKSILRRPSPIRASTAPQLELLSPDFATVPLLLDPSLHKLHMSMSVSDLRRQQVLPPLPAVLESSPPPSAPLSIQIPKRQLSQRYPGPALPPTPPSSNPSPTDPSPLSVVASNAESVAKTVAVRESGRSSRGSRITPRASSSPSPSARRSHRESPSSGSSSSNSSNKISRPRSRQEKRVDEESAAGVLKDIRGGRTRFPPLPAVPASMMAAARA